MALRDFFQRHAAKFEKDAPYQRWGALYRGIWMFLYSSGRVNSGRTHVRDGMDLKRIMIFVWIAVLPATVMGLYNIGLQANSALATMGQASIEGWRGTFIQLLVASYDSQSIWDNLIHGAAYFLPVYIVTLIVGGFWEILFASMRNKEINEGFLVTSILFALTLPPTIPLWQVALGISFGVVMAKEVFGGTGRNFLNPALAGRAFLYFAYPANMSGDAVWIAVDGYSGATPLALAVNPSAMDSMSGASPVGDTLVSSSEAIESIGVSWLDAFVGFLPGAMGETSALAILIGALFLLYTRIASWRIMLGMLLGMVGLVTLFNVFGSDANPIASLPAHWHFVIGGFAFGMVFMATDPVSAAMTNSGKWVYGILIGMLVILIRILNPAYPEGTMLAILFANLTAPLIDYVVVRANIRRRLRRNAG
jgi:Na+-transporting NADH:ubiquinone oxidoreductase subunit B